MNAPLSHPLTSFNVDTALRCARSFESWRTRALEALKEARDPLSAAEKAGLRAKARACAENARWEWDQLCKARARVLGTR